MWGEEIQEFIMSHPEFHVTYPWIPLTRHPLDSGKNANEVINITDPRKDIPFEHLIYYVWWNRAPTQIIQNKRYDSLIFAPNHDIGRHISVWRQTVTIIKSASI